MICHAFSCLGLTQQTMFTAQLGLISLRAGIGSSGQSTHCNDMYSGRCYHVLLRIGLSSLTIVCTSRCVCVCVYVCVCVCHACAGAMLIFSVSFQL